MLAIVFGFSYWNYKQAEKQQSIEIKADSVKRANAALQAVEEKEEEETVEAQNPVMQKVNTAEELMGQTMASSLKGEQQNYTIQNDKMVVTVSNRGGIIESVELKDYKTYEKTPLYLFKDKSEFNLTYFANRQNINTNQFYFAAVDPAENSVSMRLYADSVSYIEYYYNLPQGSYMMDFQVRFHNMDEYISPAQDRIDLQWSNISPQQERGFKYENQYTTIEYKYPNTNDLEKLKISEGPRSQGVNTKIEWVAFKQQFFSSILVMRDGSFLGGDLSYETFKPGSGDIKHFRANLSLPYSSMVDGYDMAFYFGPNDYKIMKSYDLDFQNLIPLGWSVLRWISIGIIIPTFDFLGRFISNYGIIILLLTIFIKLLIFPLTYRSYLSMAKMRLLKPEIDAINEKYKKDSEAMKKQQATMDLYKRAGVSPMGGCLPMLIQFPIIIAMFRFFPASIELRQQPFLWAKDLSSYDSILHLPFNIPFYGDHVSLFALLMALSMYLSTRMSMKNNPSNNTMPGMNTMMLYVMPILLLVWFNNYSAGLSYYYLLSNILTMVQTVAIRKVVNDEKLHKRMQENAKKPVKKSNFQKRLEEATKQQQAKLNQNQPKKK